MQRRGRVAGGRPHRHNVRLSQADEDAFDAAAKAAGVTVPYLLVESTRAALQGNRRMSAADMRRLAVELDGLWREIRRYGVNLNQLAAGANSGVVQGEGAVLAVLRLLGHVLQRTEQVLDQLDPDREGAPHDQQDR